MNIRYDDMRVDRLLIKEYQRQIELDLKNIGGLNDIEDLLEDWERQFADYIGTRHALALNSGTDALQLALQALDVRAHDEVIIPDVTYPAVALAVLYAGAKPVLCDCCPGTYQMDPSRLSRLVCGRTKALLAVHMFGHPAPLEDILALKKKYGFFVIEDVCQAESSEYKNRKLGSFGDLACFSFSFYKPLSSCGGGGGMLCFNDPSYRSILDCTKIWKDTPSLLDAQKRFARMYLLDLAAVKTKFRFLKGIIKSRCHINALYEKGLSDVKGLTFLDGNESCRAVPQGFVIFCSRRDGLGEFLNKNGVRWQKPYTPIHRMKNFRPFARRRSFAVSEEYFKTALHLPLYSFMKEEETQFIIDLIRQFYAHSR